ncbi:POK25 protein, partial [Eulacestoma nigropectus]|nr:POK25 protein [Eulacestoma nigropectus]
LVQTPNVPGIYQQARLSHQTFHQNAPALVRMFHLPRDEAKAIVATCPNCQKHPWPSTGSGVNPRRLQSCQLWQMDVTHIPEFRRQKYLHVSSTTDMFSGAVFASAHSGEKAEDVKKHLLLAFATLGVPEQIKTDNGPGYESKDLQKFFNLWGIWHGTGIPHS